VVKSWTVATLGHHQHHIRWPEKIAADFNKKTGRVLGKAYPITTVRRAMERKHPVLSDWGNLGISWADLMFVESQAIMTTMMELMDVHHAPGFSVHDSLVVREKDLQIAKECLMSNYSAVCGLTPVLETAFRDGTLVVKI
jgi:hypothetical protein